MNSIRRIRTSDVSIYRETRLRALKEDPHAFCATYEKALQRTEASWKEQVDNAAQGSSQAIFIAFADNQPAGLAAIYKDDYEDKEAEVFQVWVSSEARGAGLGKKLLDTTFEWARESGFHRIVATIINTNLPALGFYERYGFEKRSVDEQETKMIKETGL